ncbi:MAG: S41 family peptidase [Xanthomonadales bacterium]|nr:S41 family peptidase [Xanthomonadales bacterium]
MKKWVGAALAACLAVGAGPTRAQERDVPVMDEPGLAHSVAARRADIAAFRAEFLAQDRSYATAAREEAEARLAQLDRNATAVSQASFELELARIVALADNAHTMILADPFLRHFNRVPVRLAPFGEDFYVVRAAAEHADLLGSRLVAIDATPIAEARAAARSLRGGTLAWRDRWLPHALESVEIMHELGVAAEPAAALYAFAADDGSLLQRRLAGAVFADDATVSGTERRLGPEPMAEEGGDWRTLLSSEAAPWSLREWDRVFRWRDLPALGAFVIDLRANVDVDGRSIGDFLGEAGAAFAASGRANLVLDMRFNGGGDLTRTREFMRDLPLIVPGRIFVLISPWTFSAGISSVGYVRQAAAERVTLIGEEVGDRLHFFAEGGITQLPDSGLRILNATERHDYHTGCRGFDDCHRFVVDMPIAVESLAPDIPAPWTVDAYRAGRDPAMEAVAAALAAGPAGS